MILQECKCSKRDRVMLTASTEICQKCEKIFKIASSSVNLVEEIQAGFVCTNCGSKKSPHLVDTDILCPECGCVHDQKPIESEPLMKKDENGESLTGYSTGKGTDANQGANKGLINYFDGHIAELNEQCHVAYALRILRYYVENEQRLSNHYEELRKLVKEKILDFVKFKKLANEAIEERKIARRGRYGDANSIIYPSIDRLLRNVIISYITSHPEYGLNIRQESIQINHNHRTSKTSKNGVKPNEVRGGYEDRFPGLGDHLCLEHGHFEERSHREHFLKMKHIYNGKDCSYTTFQKQFIPGFLEHKNLKLDRMNHSVIQNNKFCPILTHDGKLISSDNDTQRLDESQLKCEKCGCTLVRKKHTMMKKLKHRQNGTHKKKYSYIITHHEITIGGRRMLVRKCGNFEQ